MPVEKEIWELAKMHLNQLLCYSQNLIFQINIMTNKIFNISLMLLSLWTMEPCKAQSPVAKSNQSELKAWGEIWKSDKKGCEKKRYFLIDSLMAKENIFSDVDLTTFTELFGEADLPLESEDKYLLQYALDCEDLIQGNTFYGMVVEIEFSKIGAFVRIHLMIP